MSNNLTNVEKAIRLEQLLIQIETMAQQAAAIGDHALVIDCLVGAVFKLPEQKPSHLKLVQPAPRGRGRPPKEKPYKPNLRIID